MESNRTRAPCRSCHSETKQIVLATREVSAEDEIEDYGPVSSQDTFEMLECCGCETVTLRHSHSFSEDPDIEVTYYPPRVSRQKPPWLSRLPRRLSSLMKETYSALDADNRRLALMGARTAVDLVLVDKVQDLGTFQEKLTALEGQGFVGRRNREFLAAALDAGNAAAHRGFQPKPDDLGHVMDIVENVLQAVYTLEDAAMQLKKVTPVREGKKPT